MNRVRYRIAVSDTSPLGIPALNQFGLNTVASNAMGMQMKVQSSFRGVFGKQCDAYVFGKLDATGIKGDGWCMIYLHGLVWRHPINPQPFRIGNKSKYINKNVTGHLIPNVGLFLKWAKLVCYSLLGNEYLNIKHNIKQTRLEHKLCYFHRNICPDRESNPKSQTS